MANNDEDLFGLASSLATDDADLRAQAVMLVAAPSKVPPAMGEEVPAMGEPAMGEEVPAVGGGGGTSCGGGGIWF